MPVVRVTATFPAEVLKSIDRQARRKGLSRSAVMSEGLRRYLASPEEAPVKSPPVVAAASDESLLAELGRRLSRVTSRASVKGSFPIDVDRGRLAEIARRYGVREVALFGSVLRSDFTSESDVDVLVEFEPGRTPGLGFVSLAEELSGLFGGRRVDLVTQKSLHPLLREEIERNAVVLYAA